MKKVGRVVLALGGAYGLLCLGVYALQEKILFHPRRLPPAFQYSFDGNVEEVNLYPSPGVRLNGLFFRTPTDSSRPSRGLVLYFHGNADNLVRWGTFAKDFTVHGYDVLMFDYRTFGKSTGVLSEAALHYDARHVYNWATTHYPESKIVLYGRSLGSGIATRLASQTHPRLLVLETPYYSFLDLGQHFMPWLPSGHLLRYSLRTDQWIGLIKCPVRLFHGTQDWVVPYQSSVKLMRLLEKEWARTPASRQGSGPEQPRLITIEGGSHKDLSTFPMYHQQLGCILKE